MFLGGLWHGAGWNYVLWGIYQGGLLIGYNLYSGISKKQLNKPFAIALTFFTVVLGWVLFRCESLGLIGVFYKSMFFGNGIESSFSDLWMAGMLVLAGLAWCFWMPNVWQIKLKPTYLNSLTLALALYVCVLLFSKNSPFLYFQF